jgi:hypothetical protein
MNTENINSLYSLLLVTEQQKLSLDSQISGLKRQVDQLEEQIAQNWEAWEQQVIAFGGALAEAKDSYGPGWKRAFKSLGYSFSYTTACRYIACAKHPTVGEEASSVEEWAAAATQLDQKASPVCQARQERRKLRAEKRSLHCEEEADCSEPPTPLGIADVVAGESLPIVVDNFSPAGLSEAFQFLDQAINHSAQHAELKPYWQVVSKAWPDASLAERSAVSPSLGNDTVVIGGPPELQNALSPARRLG